MRVDKDSAPALWKACIQGKPVNLECLLMDPRDRKLKLECLPLLLIRGKEMILLPEDSECLGIGDQLLWCGRPGVASWMEWTLRDPLVLIYLSTGEIVPRSYVWRWLLGLMKGKN
jgi:hypothetical protein